MKIVHCKWYMVHATVCVKNVVLLYHCTFSYGEKRLIIPYNKRNVASTYRRFGKDDVHALHHHHLTGERQADT